MSSKLALYNDALLHLGEQKLASLAEAREARYALDDAYALTLRYCLEQGFWNFAMRAVQVDASASVEPTFGYAYAFAKPTDWIRTLVVSNDEHLTPLLRYVDEPNYWYADGDPLFVKYVSDSTAYGADLSIWPETFANYVAIRLAARTCQRITGNRSGVADLLSLERRAKADAMSKDAMNEPPGFLPRGTWALSRGSSSNRSRWDRRTS